MGSDTLHWTGLPCLVFGKKPKQVPDLDRSLEEIPNSLVAEPGLSLALLPDSTQS